MIKLRKLLGVRGIDRRTENINPAAVKWANFFDTVLVFVLLWLPIQWYLQDAGQLSLTFIVTMDWLVWLTFVAETVTLTSLVHNKKRYLKGNWLNLFIIVAAFPFFWEHSSSYIALFRYLRLLIVLRLTAVQFHYLFRMLRLNRFGTTLFAFFIITILSGIFASFIDPSIGPPWRGIWWAWETVTTVGYGDVVPHNIAGKLFACLLMLVGVGLISIVAANFAAFLMDSTKIQKREKELKHSLKELNNRLDEIEKLNRRLSDDIQRLHND